MEMIQYKDFVQSHKDPIKSVSDETVQQAVYEWYKYRYIGFSDQEKFLDILRRNVAINYPIYQQKLRIEPGISQYDWLVQSYHERQLKTKGKSETIPEGSVSVTQYGDEIHTRTGGHSTEGVSGLHTQTTSPHVKRETVHTGTSHDEEVQGKTTQTVSPHVQKVTKTSNDHNAWSGDSQIAATLPMSKQYDKFIEPDENAKDENGNTLKQYYEKAYQHMPALDWSTASSQGQSGHREYGDDDNEVTESYKYGDGVKGDITTSEGDEKNPSTRKHFIDTKDPEKTTESYIYDAGVEGDIVKSEGDKSSPDTNKFKYDGELSDGTKGERDTIQYDGRRQETSYTGRKDTTSDEHTDREQATGRNEAPADILARASAWIEKSSAFMWFKEQIDPCFAPWYDEEGGLI